MNGFCGAFVACGSGAPSGVPSNAGSDGAGPAEVMGAADAEVAWKRQPDEHGRAPRAPIRIPARSRSGRSPPAPPGLRPARRRRPRAASRRRLEAGLGNEHVARPGRQEVGNVEASHPPLHAWDPLLEQHTLDQLGLGQVAGAGHADLAATGVLRLDLPRPLVGLAIGCSSPRPRRRAASRTRRRSARRACTCVRSAGSRAGGRRSSGLRSDIELDLLHASVPDREAAHRGLAGSASEQIRYSGSGQLSARLTSVCEGSAASSCASGRSPRAPRRAPRSRS